jgi:hypothetical protein
VATEPGKPAGLVQKSQADAVNTNGCLRMPDLCALAYSLHEMEEVLDGDGAVVQLAQSVAQHAALHVHQGVVPTSVQAWCDLLYGLTKAGLVASPGNNANPKELQQHSPHLQTLLDKGAQHLPELLTTQGARPQVTSLTLLAYAYAGYTGDLGPLIQALASNLQGCLQGVKPQECSNTLWSLGKLCEMGQQGHQCSNVQPAAYNRVLFSYALGELHSKLAVARPQNVSNAVYGCALAGHVEGVSQLLDHLCQQPHVMAGAIPQVWSNIVWAAAKLGCVEQGSVLLGQVATCLPSMNGAKPQHWSNTVWAAATLHQTAVETCTSAVITGSLQKSGRVLLEVCTSSPTALTGAISQNWSNTLWSAAVLCWYDKQLFTQGAAALAGMPTAEVEPQHLSNALYACAICAHWDDSVQHLLGRVAEYDLGAFDEQALANTLYAWAVLSCVATTSGAAQQHLEVLRTAPAALFKEASSRSVGSCDVRNIRQLLVAHFIAEQHLGVPGLPAGPVLDAARAAGWTDSDPSVSTTQRKVASTLQQLGYTVQLEMKSPDGLMSVDIGITALPDGSPCSITVEFDGTYHYVATNTRSTSPSSNRTAAAVHRLNGPTRLRNALLQARFTDGWCAYPGLSGWQPGGGGSRRSTLEGHWLPF